MAGIVQWHVGMIVDRIGFAYFENFTDGIVDEDQCDQRCKAILGETRDVLHQKAQIECDEDHQHDEYPDTDP